MAGSSRTPSETDTSKPDGKTVVATTLQIVSESKELIAAVFTAITAGIAALTAGGKTAVVATLITLLAVPLGVVGFALANRRTRRRVERTRLAAARRSAPQIRAGFRGLYPYETGERLPGDHRVLEARRVATAVASETFRFGVLCGDSGCGKSSLLQTGVTEALQAAGFGVKYFGSPIDVESKPSSAPVASRLPFLQSIDVCPPNSRIVMLVDQFEEFLIACPSAEERSAVGEKIQILLRSHPGLRILCALRREYVIDLRDLAPGLNEPLSVRNLFQLKNFTTDEAANVIRDCARTDNLIFELNFPELVAADLAEDGFVRPPELQLVCTYLGEHLDERKYRLAGGSAGILAHHVRDALSLLERPDVGARILRSFCDFATGTRRLPKPADELVEQVVAQGESRWELRKTVVRALEELEAGRLVVTKQQKDGQVFYGLVHDYLVGAVQLATQGESTRTEEANQLLRYYIRTQERYIPLARLRAIRAHADPVALDDPAARRLFRRTLNTYALRSIRTVAIMLLVVSLTVVALSARKTWNRQIVGRHWREGQAGVVGVRYLRATRKVLTQSSEIRIWDGNNGKMITSTHGQVSPSGRYAVGRNAAGYIGVTDMVSGKQFVLRRTEYQSVIFEKNDKSVAFFSIIPTPRFLPDGTINVLMSQVEVYSLPNMKLLGTVKPVYRFSRTPILLMGGARLMIPGDYGHNYLTLYDVNHGVELKAFPRLLFSGGFDYDENRERGELALLESSEQTIRISMWNLNTGNLLNVQEFGVENPDANMRIRFSRDQSLIFIGSNAFNRVLQTRNLLPTEIVGTSARVVFADSAEFLIEPYKQMSLRVRDLQGQDFSLPHSRLDHASNIIITKDGSRVLITNPQDPTELWNLRQRVRVAVLQTPEPQRDSRFSTDEQVVIITEEGGQQGIFDSFSGKRLFDDFPERNSEVLLFNRHCQQLLSWNREGQVVRYTRGRVILGWFRPAKPCPSSPTRDGA